MTVTQAADDILTNQIAQSSDHLRINASDIVLEKKIGAGTSADVYKATYRENDVAVKKLKFQDTGMNQQSKQLIKEFQREIATLVQVRHTNLVNFMGACIDSQNNQVLILTEFCFGGTLFDLLHMNKTFELTMKQRYRMAFDVAKGLNALHTQQPQILHRDLKSLNLLCVETVKSSMDYVQVKVTDFGLSRTKQEMGTIANKAGQNKMTGMAGTFHWMAPEVLTEDTNYTYKADVYSYGVVLWEIMAREPPFKSLRPHEIIFGVTQQQIRPNMDIIPANCPEVYKQIIRQCWHQDPQQRPDFG